MQSKEYNEEEEVEGNQAPVETLEIHSYDWTVRDGFGDNDHMAIHCWGLNKESKPVLARFIDFPAFCHMEFPQFVHNKRHIWNKSGADRFMEHLSNVLGEDAPCSYQFKFAEKTYYYRAGRKFPMVLMSFNNLKAMRHCTNILQNPLKTQDWGMIHCRVWEDSISAVRKLLTVRNVRYCQWFHIRGKSVEKELRVSTLEREYICEWDSMTAIPPEESKTWNTQPGVLAFDIECYSNNHRAMPDKYNALHTAYMISAIYQRYRDPSTRRRYAIIIGDCNHIPEERLDNCTIIKVNDEVAMINAFGEVVCQTDPEVITGYNILSFDYPYLDHRIKRRLCNWPAMGRITGEYATMDSKTWHSNAYGHQTINILNMEGRISIDLLPLVRRDHKLDKYDLNSVCAKFINKTKHDIKAAEMFLIYEDMRNTLTALARIVEEAQENPELLQDAEYLKRKAAAQEAFETAKDETTKVLEYCIRDSELVIELMEALNVWVGLIEMSNIVGVTLVELFTRGQQVRCVSQLYDLAANLGFILDKRDTPGFKFKGGLVYEPIPGLYDNIICLDFASLYPSIMMAYNICYTTLVPPELENEVPDEDCHIIEFDQDELENDDGADDDDEENEDVFEELNVKPKKERLVQKHYRFKFYKKREGLLPRLVRSLVTERRAVNRQIAQVKDELKGYEKLEDIRMALEDYVAGRLAAGSVKELSDRVKGLCESDPPAAPEVITRAKRDLHAAQLFDVAVTNKKLEEAKAAKLHPQLMRVAELEHRIATSGAEQVQQELTVLQQGQAEVLVLIQSLKLLIIVLDKRQLALKVSANSFFGFLGVHNGGKMPLIEGAMSITAKGRELISIVGKYIADKYQGVQVAGDTDTLSGDAPILIKHQNGTVTYKQFKDIVDFTQPDDGSKQYADLTNAGLEVWTEHGWSKIKYIMRHKTDKQMYRVLTHTGIVECTEDHSLLNNRGEEVRPGEIKVGQKLLHHNLPNVEYEDKDMDEEKAWVWGFFFAEGTCDSYECPTGQKNVWSISNQNMTFLDKAQRIMRRIEPYHDFIIDPCMASSNVDKLNVRGENLKEFAERYDKLFYTERHQTKKTNIATNLGLRYKKVPDQIIMGTNKIKEAFIQGWYDGDGNKTEGVSRRGDIKGHIGAAGLYFLLSALGYKISINDRLSKPDVVRLGYTKGKQGKHPDVIKKIIPIGPTPDYVYDIETENHHFAAGPGRMVVHNSIMFSLPNIKDSKQCNYWGLRLAQEISGIKPGEKDCDGVLWPDGRPGLFPPPLGVEFEKAMRLLCLRKKKYAAYLIGKDGTFKTEEIKDKHGNVIGNKLAMLKKGIVLARRDNCPVLRDLYTKILELIMNKSSLDQAINVLVDSVQDLLDGRVPVEKLVTIRELGANYKSDSYFMKVFSEQLKRNGKIVNPGDRLDFVIVEDPTATLLGHKMRLLEQYNERLGTVNEEKIDYNYYIEKSLMNPINQLFEVGFKDTIAKLQHVQFRPSNRHKPIHLDEPVKIILKMREKGFDLKQLKEGVKYNLDKLHGVVSTPRQVVLKLAGIPVTPAKPAGEPVVTKPVVEPVMTKPAFEPVMTKPVVEPVRTPAAPIRILRLVTNAAPTPTPAPVAVIPRPLTTRPPVVLPKIGGIRSPPNGQGMPPPLIMPRIAVRPNPPSPSKPVATPVVPIEPIAPRRVVLSIRK